MARRIVLIDIGVGLSLVGVLPAVTLGVEYSAQLFTRNGVAPYAYSLVAGTLPDGLFLDPATGIITGTTIVAGNYPLTIRSTDATGTYIERDYRLTVTAETFALEGAFADATTDNPYSSDLIIAGGVPPYSNPRVVAGMLPAGLESLEIFGTLLRLSGAAAGPAGTADFTVAVDDAAGQTVTSEQSIEVTLAVGTTLNPNDADTSILLSNGNLTAYTNGGQVGTVRSTNPKTTGKYYFEVVVDQSVPSATPGVGVASANTELNYGFGLGSAPPANESLKYRYDGGIVSNGAFENPACAAYINGDVLMFAVDVDTGHLWAGKNGVWGASGNPAAGTNFKTFTVNGAVYAAVTISGGAQYTFRFASTSWSYAAPSGFVKW